MDNDLIKVLMILILLSFIQVPVFATPQWSNNNSYTPPTYSPSTLSEFNVTWDNANDTVLIEINYTGSPENYTMTETYGLDVYNYSIILPAGTFQWKSYANDTTGSWNYTNTWTVTINQVPTEINLTLNGAEGNMSCEQYDNITFVAQINVPGLNISLTSNYPGINETNTTIIDKTVNLLTESEDLCCVTALYSGNLNYSESSSTTYFFDTKGPQYSGISISDTTYSLNKIYYFNISWSDATLNQTWFEFNYTNGTVLTYTNEIQNSDNIFWIGLTGLYVGPNYTYKWYANDSLGMTNNTTKISYNISPKPVLNYTLNCYDYDSTNLQYSNVSCWSIDTDITKDNFTLSFSGLTIKSLDNTGWYYYGYLSPRTSDNPYIFNCTLDASVSQNYTGVYQFDIIINDITPTEDTEDIIIEETKETSGYFISNLNSFSIKAGETVTKSFLIENTYYFDLPINVLYLDGEPKDNGWCSVSPTKVTIPKRDSKEITLTCSVPRDALVKNYDLTVNAGINQFDMESEIIILTVEEPLEELITTEQPEINVTANETAAPTGLFPFNLIDPMYIVLIVGIVCIALILVFKFRSNITEFVSRGYKPKPIKEKRIELKPQPEEKLVKKKPEKRRFPLSGLKLRLTLVKEKKEEKEKK